MDKEASLARQATRDREDAVAERIAGLPHADWKAMPADKRRNFISAARRAIAAVKRYEKVEARRIPILRARASTRAEG